MKINLLIVAALLSTPPALCAESTARPVVSVRIAKDGAVLVAGKRVSLEEFQALIAKAAKQDKETIVRISAPPDADHTAAIPLFEICRKVGITRIFIETSLEKTPNKSPEPTR